MTKANECPACGLVNPPEAGRCDCGHIFAADLLPERGRTPAPRPEFDDEEGPLLCARCGSDRVVPRATIWDQGEHSSGSLKAYVYADPDALFDKEPAYATLYAQVCAECGHVEVYTSRKSAKGLYRAYRKSEEPDER